MKKVTMLVFSLVFTAVALIALFLAAEHVRISWGMPRLPAEFWESGSVVAIKNALNADNDIEFRSGVLAILQVICLILFLICRSIGNGIMAPMRQYTSLKGFKWFVRSNLMLYRIASLFWVISFAGYILEAVPRADWWGEFFWTCIFFGIPGLFTLLTLPRTFGLIFFPISGFDYCSGCRHGCKGLFKEIGSVHLHDEVEETTYRITSGGSTRLETRETGRRQVCRVTYTCVNCGNEHTRTEKRIPAKRKKTA